MLDVTAAEIVNKSLLLLIEALYARDKADVFDRFYQECANYKDKQGPSEDEEELRP